MCHLLTRYQSTIFPNHKSCVRKKGVPQWNGLKDKDYRVELTIKNEHLKEFYQWKGEAVPDELLMATLASQSQSQDLLFDMLYYFSNRLLRFRYNGKGVSIFQL